MDDVKSRLAAYLDAIGVNKSEFGRAIGVSSAYISSIRKSIQPDKLDKISQAYPDLNITWLLTGEGNMTKAISQTVGEIHGNAKGVNVNGTILFNDELKDTIDKFLDEIAAQRKITEKYMEQMDKILKLLEDRR